MCVRIEETNSIQRLINQHPGKHLFSVIITTLWRLIKDIFSNENENKH